jgi:hypothetical protein
MNRMKNLNNLAVKKTKMTQIHKKTFQSTRKITKIAIILQMDQISQGIREKSVAMDGIRIITIIVIIKNQQESRESLTIIATEHLLNLINR